MQDDSEQFDVIVVGAGVAGLAAAQALHRAGKQVVIIEARNRIGGRLYTRRDLANVPIELGGELIHGTRAATWEVVNQERIRTVELGKAHDPGEADDLNLSALPKPAPKENVEEYLKRIHMDGKRMPSYLQFLSVDDEPLRRMNARAFLAYYSHQSAHGELYGDHDFRVPDGYDQLPKALAKGLTIRLESVVQEVNWQQGGVKVSFLHDHKIETLKSKAVLITLPVGVLRHGDVRFVPALPPSKVAAIQDFSTVDVAKMIYVFDTKVLPEGVDQLHDFTHNPPMWWRGSAGHPHLQGDVVIAWTAGDNARSLLEQDYDSALLTGMQSLRKLLHDDKLQPKKAIMHNWTGDPYARGAYSFLLADSDEARDDLGKPIDGKLFWAGEATSEDNGSTVHGAYESGLRAAQEISTTI